MKIGVLGSGDVGQALGSGLISLGNEVKMGCREAGNEKARAWVAKSGARASQGTFADAAAFADLAVLATLWSGTENVIQQAEPKNLAGKVVIDATNPLVFTPNEPPSLALGHTDSGGEQVQRWLPKSRVVKCFNIVGHAHMVHPDFPGGPPDMFLCGNDAEAKKTVTGICQAFGWPVVDIGGIEGARLLEPICILWVLYGIRSKSWNHAFKLLRS
jgi:8-hydroxy-5-deazaflavin:NADPH oxidoreductase